METGLLEIVTNGDAIAFCQALDQNPFLLDSPIVATPYTTPLHVASSFGHEELAGEILRRRPGLANCCDARSLYPLHIAAANGHVGIAKMILGTDSSLSLCRDKDGRTPLHLAAANGHVALLEELLPTNESFSGMVTATGETVLHLSVEFNQVEVVKVLLERQKELINLKDDRGFTALHHASAKQNAQIMKLLLHENSVEVNALNENGFTALDIWLQYPNDTTQMEICNLLLRFGAKKGLQNQEQHMQQSTDKRMLFNLMEKLIINEKNMIMIVSTLVAGATFQVGLDTHIRSDESYIIFFAFMLFNTAALSLSMFIIFLFVSGLYLTDRVTITLRASILTMWIAFMIGAYSSLCGRGELTCSFRFVLFPMAVLALVTFVVSGLKLYMKIT